MLELTEWIPVRYAFLFSMTKRTEELIYCSVMKINQAAITTPNVSISAEGKG